ncbi:hypothetical protein SAMN04487975_105178 [Planococcus glaciei]|uniref:hypothetical protein n=1 Tax=Planococcus glaciei TaxID=459472 RepID=UPI00087FAACC|nr:hypothetical protein [Planococcus glaciei]SDH54365.1 hypothetical protein SAMN04487975_105178 [Planococcus glaciei]
MRAKILSTKAEGSAISYICELTLKEYIENLPISFMEYDIQRGIVSNIYLDNLIDTVLTQASIPPITLIAEESNIISEKNEQSQLSVERFRILDGLQRTYRLKIIWDTIKFFIEYNNTEMLGLNKFKLSKEYGKELQKINSSTLILEKIIKFYNKNNCNQEILLNTFSTNIQWFVIWSDISIEKQVEKMLILNAGHKAVPIRHQLELLFINLIPYFEDNKNLILIREKEKSSTFYAKKREIREFHFAHLISSVLSFANGKTITTNASLINKLQETDSKMETYHEFFTYQFLDEMIEFLTDFDDLIANQYGEEGTQWLGRETVIIGIFGALGKLYEDKYSESYSQLFRDMLKKVEENPGILNLENYKQFRNNMNISKINIGNFSKKVVFDGIYNLLKKDQTIPINWNLGGE